MEQNSTTDAVYLWRKALRQALIARREAVPHSQFTAWNDAITAAIEAGLPVLSGMVIGFCWPFRGEFDARFAIRHFRALGSQAALPAVVARGGPLEFRKWWPGAALKPGVWSIPVPEGTGVLVPDAVLVPVNGFDEQGYRLGYGGAHFDATLGAISPRPIAIGVGFELARLASIQPQPHDIAMDFIVTEAGLHAVVDGALRKVDAAECEARARALRDARGLPRAQPNAASYNSPACYAGEFPGHYDGGAPPVFDPDPQHPRKK